MCLSIAYELREGEKVKLCEYVSGISMSPGKVCLSDIMGAELVVEGSLEKIDLVKNEILITPVK